MLSLKTSLSGKSLDLVMSPLKSLLCSNYVKIRIIIYLLGNLNSLRMSSLTVDRKAYKFPSTCWALGATSTEMLENIMSINCKRRL